MPTPAEVLLENSTLDTGTPWEHLNAQESGGGRYVSEFAITFDTEPVQVLFDQSISGETFNMSIKTLLFDATIKTEFFDDTPR